MINIIDESSTLKSVVLGIADDIDFNKDKTDWIYDPKTKYYFEKNKLFLESKPYVDQIESFANVLKKHGVNVFRPLNIKGLNQIFSRDVAFVIEDKFFISNIIPNRESEIKAMIGIDDIKQESTIFIPDSVKVEGGDVLLYLDYIFVGYSNEADLPEHKGARTNINAVDFIKKYFPNKKIVPIEMNKFESGLDNVLHLDCCFNILRNEKALIYKKGFKNSKDVEFIINLFGKENIFEVNNEQMYNLNTNLFSISPNLLVTDFSFDVVNNKLLDWNFNLEKIDYSQISKLGGLFRCSTLPLRRG